MKKDARKEEGEWEEGGGVGRVRCEFRWNFWMGHLHDMHVISTGFSTLVLPSLPPFSPSFPSPSPLPFLSPPFLFALLPLPSFLPSLIFYKFDYVPGCPSPTASEVKRNVESSFAAMFFFGL